jgi:hypothetical protein
VEHTKSHRKQESKSIIGITFELTFSGVEIPELLLTQKEGRISKLKIDSYNPDALIEKIDQIYSIVRNKH